MWNALKVGVIIGSFVAAGHGLANAIPTDRVVNEIRHVRIVRHNPPPFRDRIVYRLPGDSVKPVDAKAICSGSLPAQVVSSVLNGEGNNHVTWVTVTPVGSDVRVFCHKTGDYTQDWTAGVVVALPNAEND